MMRSLNIRRPCFTLAHARRPLVHVSAFKHNNVIFSLGPGRTTFVRFKEGTAPDVPNTDHKLVAKKEGVESDSMPISSSAGFGSPEHPEEFPGYPHQMLETPEQQVFAHAHDTPASNESVPTGLSPSIPNSADISSGLREFSSSPATEMPSVASTPEDLGVPSTGELPEVGSISGPPPGQAVSPQAMSVQHPTSAAAAMPDTPGQHPASAAALQSALNATGAPDLDEKLAGQLHVAPTGPYENQPPMGVRLDPALGFGFTALAAGWLAVAMSAMFSPAATTHMLFPSAKGQLGGFACVIMWGATLVPVAAAALSLQDAVHSSMVGTSGSNYLTAALFAASMATLVVTLQAVSLRHPALLGIVGGLSLLGTGLAAWITSKAHPWRLPLPNFKGTLTSLLSFITPHTWQAAVFGIIGLSLAGVASQLVLVTPESVNLLLGGTMVPGPGPDLAESLAVFTSRSAAGALLCASMICLVLKEAADRHLLATPFARRLSNSLAMSSTIKSITLIAALLVGVTAPNLWVFITLLGQLGVAAWTITTSIKPAEIQSLALPNSGSLGGPSLGDPPPVVVDAKVRHLYDNARVLQELARRRDPGF